MLGVYVSGVSGGHINPAVTFANCIYRKFPWRKFPIYVLAQTLGAFCASGIVYGAMDAFHIHYSIANPLPDSELQICN